MARDPAERLDRREGRRPRRAWQYAKAVLAGAAIVSCEPAERSPEVVRDPLVRPGIDVLLSDSAHLVRGRRVGLITNQTGRTADGRASIDALRDAGVELAALFSPEHGIRGVAKPGEHVADTTDASTGLPVRSLYGATRKPTPAMLADIGILLFDIQDIGARYYTYAWTMTLAMQAAAENGLPFVVLDRPDPISGTLVSGNVLDPAFASFVGAYPVPMRHGMTVGELARYVNAEFGIGADLTVIPLAGWTRSRWFDETGLAWVAPSPNMPDLESATHYPGTCLFEGTNLSVGRGTDRPFQQIGAPWLDAEAIVRSLDAHHLDGIRFEVVEFMPAAPADAKYDGVPLHGVRFIVTDRERYDPTRVAIHALVAVRERHGTEMTISEGFDRLAGTDELRRALLGGTAPDSIVAGWRPQLDAFAPVRARYLLYR